MTRHRRPRKNAAHIVREIELTLGPPASGGACVAHADDAAEKATYFVYGGLPGERVVARTTGSVRGGKVRFATVADVLTPSPDRVVPPCPLAGSCGGCDFQHVAMPAQRDWKAQVLRDQLRRLGGIEQVGGLPLGEAIEVAAVPLSSAGGPPDSDDWVGWRTRVTVETDSDGRVGFHAHRSAEVVPVAACPVAAPQLREVFTIAASPGIRVHASVAEVPTLWAEHGEGEPDVPLPAGWRRRAWVTRDAVGRSFRVATDGFWQGHVSAPDLLANEVRRLAGLRSGDRALDLYSGVGLFAAALATAADPPVSVVAVEGDPRAVRFARRNLHDLPSVRVVDADVRDYPFDQAVEVTVLDPPRAGAGVEVIDAVGEITSRAIVHVGCDGAATARDLGRLVGSGWRIQELRAFDLFPMTQHLETVALLERSLA